ncbi:hypothetical protein CEXT_653051, partial [Caerostris extrusa]
ATTNIYALSSQRLYSIRFDLRAVDGEKEYALYETFWIDDEPQVHPAHPGIQWGRRRFYDFRAQ